MNDRWILSLVLFLLTDSSTELMKLLNSENFDMDYEDIFKSLEDTDADTIKEYIVSKLTENKEKLRMMNNAFKQSKEKM